MKYDSLEDISQAYNSPIKNRFFAFFFSPKSERFPGIFIHLENDTILFWGEVSTGKIFGLPMGNQTTKESHKEFTKPEIKSLSLVLKREALQYCQRISNTEPKGYTDFTKKRRFLRDYVTQIMLQSGEVLYFEPSRTYEIIDTLTQGD